MASDAITALILLIGSILVAASVTGTAIQTVGSFTDSFEQRADQLSSEIETDVEIINDPDTNGTYNSSTDTLTVYVKNTGENSLSSSSSDIDLFINGTYTDIDNTALISAESWRPGTVVELTVNMDLASGLNQVKVVINGDESELEFYL